MNAILLLSAMMAGQVKGGPPAAQSRPGASIIAPRIYTYRIRHEGLRFYVRGYYRPDIQRIVWNEVDEFNQRTYSVALVTQATFGDEQEYPPVALVARPLIASRPASVVPVMQTRNGPGNSRN